MAVIFTENRAYSKDSTIKERYLGAYEGRSTVQHSTEYKAFTLELFGIGCGGVIGVK
ncbi:3215_t:CDS:2, partial [Gigaspora rosea]